MILLHADELARGVYEANESVVALIPDLCDSCHSFVKRGFYVSMPDWTCTYCFACLPADLKEKALCLLAMESSVACGVQ